MKILFSVGGLVHNLNLEEQVLTAKRIGFDGVDYIGSTRDLFFPPKRILRATSEHNVAVMAIHIPVLLVIHTPGSLINNILNLYGYFPDSQIFNFHLSGFINPLGNGYDKLEKFMQKMRANKILFSCESNPNEYLIFKYYPKETYDPELFAQFCISHNLPINLDTSHIAAWGYDIVSFFNKYYKNINLLHLSDMNENKQHLPFGKGTLPLRRLFKAMKRVSYNGIVIFEVSNFPKKTSMAEFLSELKENMDLFKSSAL